MLEIFLTRIILPVYQSACRAAADHCRKKGRSITKLAMQYSLMNNEISTILVGMNSSEQVDWIFWAFAFYAAYPYYCLMNK
jgi:L-galactose dehydrogenase